MGREFLFAVMKILERHSVDGVPVINKWYWIAALKSYKSIPETDKFYVTYIYHKKKLD